MQSGSTAGSCSCRFQGFALGAVSGVCIRAANTHMSVLCQAGSCVSARGFFPHTCSYPPLIRTLGRMASPLHTSLLAGVLPPMFVCNAHAADVVALPRLPVALIHTLLVSAPHISDVIQEVLSDCRVRVSVRHLACSLQLLLPSQTWVVAALHNCRSHQNGTATGLG